MSIERSAAAKAESASGTAADAATDASMLVDGIRAGRMRAIGRAISEVERDSHTGRELVAALAQRIGGAHRIGITGPPGAGKSSLVGELIQRFEQRGHRVGVIAVDPSSRTSGGAVLGDRIRMDRNSGSRGAFIRSLGSRGETGGLSLAASRAADVLDAAGYDPILIETVGAGQAEVEIGEVAHTRVVVLPPGHGDEVQATKAGMMEIADIFVVSKSDMPDARRMQADLLALLRLRPPVDERGSRGVRVIGTSIIDGQGVDALVDELLERGTNRPHGAREGALARLVVRRALRTIEQRLASLPGHRLVELGLHVARGESTLDEAARAALDAALESPRDLLGARAHPDAAERKTPFERRQA